MVKLYKNRVVDATNTNILRWYIRAIFERREDISLLRWKAYIKPAKLMTHIGIVIQNTHFQDVYCPIAPPTGIYMDPIVRNCEKLSVNSGQEPSLVFVPNVHANALMVRYFGRSLRVVMSLIITVTRVRHPHPPRPRTTRAAANQSMFFTIAQRILPKKIRRMRIS